MPSVTKKRTRLTSSAPHVSTNGVRGNGGGIIAGSRERDGAAVAHPTLDVVDPPFRDEALEAVLASATADPERHRAAEQRSGGGECDV